MNLNDAWVVEYSPNQEAFIIERLSRAIATNLEIFDKQRGDAYMILGIYSNEQTARDAWREIVKTHRA